MRRYPGGGAFALFFHPHPREFATQDKKSANARGLAPPGGGWAQLELTDALRLITLALHLKYSYNTKKKISKWTFEGKANH